MANVLSIEQLPGAVIQSFIAGSPWAFNIDASAGALAITSPELILIDISSQVPVLASGPTPTVASKVVSVAFSASQTAALNTRLRGTRSYAFSVRALVGGQGPYELAGGELHVKPRGSTGTSTATTLTLPSLTVGAVTIPLTITLGGVGVAGAVAITAIPSLPGAATVQAALEAIQASRALDSSRYAPGFARTALPKKQTQTIVTSFATGHGYTDSLTGSIAADTATYLVGSRSLKITTGSGTSANAHKTGYSINMTGRAWGILLRVEDFTKLDQINFYAADTAESNYDVWTFARNNQGFKDSEWVWISLPYGNNSVVGSTPRANVQHLTVRVVPVAGQVANVWVQQIVHFPVQTTYSTGVASIGFDDGRSTVMLAAQKMAAYGYRGQVYIIPELVGTAGYLTLAELQTLRNTYGWGIGLDGAPGGVSSYLSLSAADLDTYVRGNKQYLYDNGLVTSGVDHISYPGIGNVNDSVISVVSKYAVTGHTGVIAPVPGETLPPLDPMRMRSVSGISGHAGGVSVATTQGYIDAAVANDSWINLIFHGVVTPTTATTEITPTDFDTILAYLASSTIAVRPVGEVMSPAPIP